MYGKTCDQRPGHIYSRESRYDKFGGKPFMCRLDNGVGCSKFYQERAGCPTAITVFPRGERRQEGNVVFWLLHGAHRDLYYTPS